MDHMIRQLDLFRKSDEIFAHRIGHLFRWILVESGSSKVSFESCVPCEDEPEDPKGAWWEAYLAGVEPKPIGGPREPEPPIVLADLFCGMGGLSLGVSQFFKEAGRKCITKLACDLDKKALAVYQLNHETEAVTSKSVADLVALNEVPHVDIVVAGPPCQGYSGLNVTGSRFNDPRNSLYLSTAQFAVMSRCRAVIIENVPGAVHDQGDIVTVSRDLLEANGYHTSLGVWHADKMGWSQTRSRLFLIGVLGMDPFPHDLVFNTLFDMKPRSVTWGIKPPLSPEPWMHVIPAWSEETQKRVDWLFDNDAYEGVPTELLPPSKQDTKNSFAGYQRLRPNQPVGTLVTSFSSPGNGRVIHPTERRTLTIAEGARLQGFPATYQYVTDPAAPPSKTDAMRWIGNAVPMPLGYAAGLAVSPIFLSKQRALELF